MIHRAPSLVGLRRKSRHDDLQDARDVVEACMKLRWTSSPMPVLSADNRYLGWVYGNQDTGVASWVPPTFQAAPFESYDQFIFALTAAKRFTFQYWKPSGSSTNLQWLDFWRTVGNPSEGTYSGTARTARQFSDSTQGAMSHGGNVSPSEKYLVRYMPFGTVSGRSYILYDRVLSYDQCTMTAGNQTMTNSLAAQRYISTGQPGLRICLTADAVHNATAADLTQLQYTDQSGNTLQSMPTSPTVSKIPSCPAPTDEIPAEVCAPAQQGNTARGDAPFLPLAAGDTGVRLIDNYTWSAAPTGTTCYVLLYPLAFVPAQAGAGCAVDLDLVQDVQTSLTRIYDGACLSVLYAPMASTTAGHYEGTLEFVWT